MIRRRLTPTVTDYQHARKNSDWQDSVFRLNVTADIMGYSPNIETDESKPQGVSSRYSDPTLMREVYQPKVSLLAGLTRIIEGGT